VQRIRLQINEVHWSEQTKPQRKRERNVCRFEAAAWGRGALRDFGPSGCEGDYIKMQRFMIHIFDLLGAVARGENNAQFFE